MGAVPIRAEGPDRPHRHGAVAILVATALFFLVTATAVAAERETDYGARVAPTGDTTRTVFAHAVEVGASVEDTLQIINYSDEPALFEVYEADMVASTGDVLVPASRDAGIIGAGAWLTPEVDVIEVAARSDALVDFTIEIPTGTAAGDYVAALLVERQEEQGSANIETRTRIGLRVEIEVLGEIDLGLILGDLGWDRFRGDIALSLPVANTGNVTFETMGSVSIVEGDGEPIAEMTMEPTTVFLAPGQNTELTAEWLDTPLFGKYEARATVTAVVGSRSPVEFLSEPVTIWIIPWMEIITVLALIGLLIWFFVATRRPRRRWAKHRREEKALIQEYRQRRKLEENTSSAESGKHRS
jgi:hypothetical protein